MLTLTSTLTRVLPISAQRSFRDGAFRAVSDYGVAVAAGVSAVFQPRLAARFLAVGRQREDYRYGAHPRQVRTRTDTIDLTGSCCYDAH